uniref:ZP domain-containing protein n=2 Tax=Bursaphelenchus xylophilus TaxID=6326 RepID=A0A1I7SHU6_BURXY
MELLNGDKLIDVFPTETLQIEFEMAPNPRYENFMVTDCWFGNDHMPRDEKLQLVTQEGCPNPYYTPLMGAEPIHRSNLDRKVVLNVHAFMNQSTLLKRAFDFDCQLWFCEKECPVQDCAKTAAGLLHPLHGAMEFLSEMFETK